MAKKKITTNATFVVDKPFIAKLATWHNLKAEAASLVEQERVLRGELFGMAFPSPTEGSSGNKIDLPDGYMLQGTYKINRTIDEGALGEVEKRMDAVAFASAFVYKPELSKSGFNALSDEQKKIAALAIIAKPGTPALEIVQKKK